MEPKITNTYRILVHEIFEQLTEKLEDAGLDVELSDGVMEITTTDSKVFLVNRHEPTSQIWLSSPISGAHHFRYDQQSNIWQHGENIFPEILFAELKSLGVSVV